VENKICYVCGKEKLSKDEVGLTKKLLGRKIKVEYCLNCLSDYLETDTESLLAKIEEFKEQGCVLF